MKQSKKKMAAVHEENSSNGLSEIQVEYASIIFHLAEKKKYRQVKPDQVLWVQSEGDHVCKIQYYFRNEKGETVLSHALITRGIGFVRNALSKFHVFMSPHKSWIVNMPKVIEVDEDSWMLISEDGELIEIAYHKRKEVLDLFLHHAGAVSLVEPEHTKVSAAHTKVRARATKVKSNKHG